MLISKSKIKTLQTCPRMFYYQYIEHRRPDVPTADVTIIGLEIHGLFNKFYDNIKEPIPEEPFEYFINSMEVPLRYKGIWNAFCKMETERYKKDKEHFFPVLREKMITVEDMRGIIDRIDYNGTDYTIIDYKSNVSNPSNLRFELCFYKMLVDKSGILDKSVQYVGSYGYKTGEVFIEKVKQRSYNSMLKKVEQFRNMKFKDIEYESKPSYACNWCNFRRSCKC